MFTFFPRVLTQLRVLILRKTKNATILPTTDFGCFDSRRLSRVHPDARPTPKVAQKSDRDNKKRANTKNFPKQKKTKTRTQSTTTRRRREAQQGVEANV